MRLFLTMTSGIAAFMFSSVATAQESELMRFEPRPHQVISGEFVGGEAFNSAVSDDERTAPELTSGFSTIVREAGVNLIRVHFDAFDLGDFSEIRIMSLKDGATQRFRHAALVEWNGWSAIFNGDAVLVQLLVAPNERASFTIDEIAVNDPVQQVGGGDGGVATLCGADNRVTSTDSRCGRLSGANCGSGGGCGGCTAWLTSIGSAVTAGHCGTAGGGLIEFNVPLSSSSGNPVAANPDDQYPVGNSYYAYQNGGVGFDWAIMDVGKNSNTGVRAHWVQGYYHIEPFYPSDGSTLRVTGYGIDNTPAGSAPGTCCGWDGDGNCTHFGCNSKSLTEQTATGPTTDHTDSRLMYAVDTEPANSGSPVIYEANGIAMGVHTNGGCEGGENSGTRLAQDVMAVYLDDFINNWVFCDFQPISGSQYGTALEPTWNLGSAMNVVSSGGTVVMAGGTYPASLGNSGVFNKAMTIRAVSGVVSIGN